METIGNIRQCNTCGRKFLIEQVLFGINHTLDTIVTCWECCQDSPFIKQNVAELYPDIELRFQKYLKDK